MSAPLPPNEPERLATLRSYSILNTIPEEAFDDLALLASEICGTPMAQISLLDADRQWFKARIGVPMTESPRDTAFCAHTILHTEQVMEVTDARRDERFAESPLVKGKPEIRFYAGAPLVAPNGHALGALCVMDSQPRALTERQRAALKALSRRVVAQLELRRHSGEVDRQVQLGDRSRLALLSLLEDEKRSVHNLRESEDRFRQVVENIREVFWMTDVEKSRMIYISPRYEIVWGRPCAEIYASPRSWLDSVHPEDRARVMEAVRTKQLAGTYDETFRIVRPDGETRWIRARAFPVKDADGIVRKIVGASDDITEQKAMETQFLHAQRIEAIGTLASGVAHDLNNILAPVLMVAGLLKETAHTDRDRELLSMIELSSQRGADIIRQLLAFSRGLTGERLLIQPKHLVRDMLTLMRETFPRNIRIEEHASSNIRPIQADPTQIHQVIMNLCVNARDAMPNGGLLNLSLENIDVPADAPASAEPGPGQWTRLTIADTGHGIPPEIIEKIFDPFFTTKERGKGTGLGLSTVVGIVRNHGGYIKVDSQPGLGTDFLVYFPSVQSSEIAERIDAPPAPSGGNELVLVVDDEEPIRWAAQSFLETNGYLVMTAASGEEAMKLFIERRDAVQLVLTDMMMPGMDGLSLLRALRILKPDLKCIAMSGLDQTLHEEDLRECGVNRVLGKPFAPAELLRTIAAELRA